MQIFDHETRRRESRPAHFLSRGALRKNGRGWNPSEKTRAQQACSDDGARRPETPHRPNPACIILESPGCHQLCTPLNGLIVKIIYESECYKPLAVELKCGKAEQLHTGFMPIHLDTPKPHPEAQSKAGKVLHCRHRLPPTEISVSSLLEKAPLEK